MHVLSGHAMNGTSDAFGGMIVAVRQPRQQNVPRAVGPTAVRVNLHTCTLVVFEYYLEYVADQLYPTRKPCVRYVP